VWLTVALALLAIFAGQELLEGSFASGHLGGLAAVVGDGGWWAAPVALLVGGLLALALRGADALEQALDATRIALRVRARGDGGLAARPRVAPALARLAPLARSAAGRAPPHALALL
jgi:hypothetical protein